MRRSVAFGVTGLGYLLAGSFLVAACGGDGETGERPDETGGTSGTGTGGTGGSGTGGTSGTSGTGGTSSCVAPVTMCTPPCTPTTCEPVTPTQALLTDFSNLENGQLFGAKDSTGAYIPNWYEPGNFFGGVFAYPIPPDMCSADMTPVAFPITSDACNNEWRISGTVGTYSGLGIWMETCIVDMSEYSGVSFKIGGNVGPTGTLKFSISTSGNLAPDMCKTNKGTCTLDVCTAASTMITVPATATVVTVPFSQLTGGAPEAGVNPAEITSFQFDFDCTDCEATPYPINLTIDDITLVP